MSSDRPLELPAPLRHVLPAARWQVVTIGESGASVYRSVRFVVKVRPRGATVSGTLFAEKERLRWLAGRVPVPGVVAYHADDEAEYLAMTRVPGIDLSHEDARVHARRNTDLLARALRELHALPIRECPFDMSLRVALAEGRERVLAGHAPAALWNELARTRPAHEDLVVTHGDACLPNVIVSGEFVEGFVDVGRAGIADRHVDLALATRSLARNYGEPYPDLLLDTYGRALVDDAKLAYFGRLDELV